MGHSSWSECFEYPSKSVLGGYSAFDLLLTVAESMNTSYKKGC